MIPEQVNKWIEDESEKRIANMPLDMRLYPYAYRDGFKEGAQFGYNLDRNQPIDIVEGDNSTLPPEVDDGITEWVLVMLADGSTDQAFYNYQYGIWTCFTGASSIKPIKWKYISW